MLAGIEIEPAGKTVTVSVALATLAEAALAVITELPAVTPVTLNVVEVELPGIVTVIGSETIPVGLAERFTTRPAAGAGPDRATVKVCVPVPVMVAFCGPSVSEALTLTLVEDET
jgi:hypothetical protein